MQVRKNAKGYLVRLETGEELVGTLTKFAKDNDIRGGQVTAIGAVSLVELGFYELAKKEYHWKKFEEDMEIVSLGGNIATLAEGWVVHIHGVFSSADFQAIGGHVKTAIVGASAEIVITVFDEEIERYHNEATGLNLWEI